MERDHDSVRVQIVLDRELLKETDAIVSASNSNRSAFIRDALRSRLSRLRMLALEEKDRAGYERTPETAEELADYEAWHQAQEWPDE